MDIYFIIFNINQRYLPFNINIIIILFFNLYNLIYIFIIIKMFKLKGEFMTISELSKIFIKFESYLILILFSLGALYSIFDYIHETKKFNIDSDQLKKIEID